MNNPCLIDGREVPNLNLYEQAMLVPMRPKLICLVCLWTCVEKFPNHEEGIWYPPFLVVAFSPDFRMPDITQFEPIICNHCLVKLI